MHVYVCAPICIYVFMQRSNQSRMHRIILSNADHPELVLRFQPHTPYRESVASVKIRTCTPICKQPEYDHNMQLPATTIQCRRLLRTRNTNCRFCFRIVCGKRWQQFSICTFGRARFRYSFTEHVIPPSHIIFTNVTVLQINTTDHYRKKLFTQRK